VDFVVVEVEGSIVEVLFGVVASNPGSFSCSGVETVTVIHVKPGIKKFSLLKPMISIGSSASSGQGGRVVKVVD